MKSLFCALIIILCLYCGMAYAVDEVVFVGGAPLETYQPQVIVPLLKEAFRRNGVSFSAKAYPSPRALFMSNSGQADGELHRVYEFHEVSDGKYPNLVRIESQLMSIRMVAFSRKDIPIKDWADLKRSRVAYQRGRQNAEKHLGKNMSADNIHPKNSDLIAFRMLAEGRVDYVVSEDFEGRRMIRHNPELAGISVVGVLMETKIYAYMHKKHSKLAKRTAATLDEMKKDGTFQDIVSKVREKMISRD